MNALPSVPVAALALTIPIEQYRWPPTIVGDKSRPWLRVNFAASADGAVTGEDGKSRSVSGTADKLVFGLLRATCDAVIVGAGTARTEDYGQVIIRDSMEQLRAAQDRTQPPALVVVTRTADLDPGSKMFTNAIVPTIVITCESAPPSARTALSEVADVVLCGEDSVDLTIMISRLAERGLQRLLCEGGPHLFADLLTAELVDDVCLTISPVLVGANITDGAGLAHDPGRIIAGSTILCEPVTLTLASAIESDGALLARYLVSR